MSQEQSFFKFDLNESIYFEKGQEVREMLQVSLEPDISIQSFNEYVSIRGVIELQGEYKKKESEQETIEQLDKVGEDPPKRFVEKVYDKNEEEVEFFHRFPVEISIPSYRVDNLDDISVSIEAFDYELPSDDHFILKSTIKIHGVNEEESLKTEHVENIERNTDIDDKADDDFIHTNEPAFTNRTEDVIDDETDNDTAVFSFDIKNHQNVQSNLDNDDTLKSLDKESDRWKFKETQTLEQFFNKGSDKEQSMEAEVNEQVVSSEMDNEEEDIVDASIHTEESNLQIETSVTANEEDKGEEETSIGKTLTTYLSSMFRDNEEEQYTKMRLCIVQEDDTVESIAKRYEVSALKLVNENKITDGDLTAGQLLYIPVKK